MSQCSFNDIIGASRPPLWFASAFAYCLSVSNEAAFRDPGFWCGLLYFTFPFNLLLCGLNDVADWDVDHLNPKRNSAWRRCLEHGQLKSLAFWSIFIQLPFFSWALICCQQGPWHVALWIASAFTQISLYNGFLGLPQTSRISCADLPMNIWAWLLPTHFAWIMSPHVKVCIFRNSS